MTRFHASAPTRLDFAGGWTDVAPFATEEGGAVVNAAIDLLAHAEVTVGGEGYRLQSDDLDQSLTTHSVEGLSIDGRLDLLKAGLRMMNPGPCTLRTWSDAPAGSGLGSSGALDVAMLAALRGACGKSWRQPDLAEEAFRLESEGAKHPGGRQDQYAAALGGWNLLTFGRDATGIRPLRIAADFAAELARRTVLCYTGKSRVSGNTIARVMGAYARNDGGVRGALRRMVELAGGMAEALEGGDIVRVANLLSANWIQQQRLDPGMCTDDMAKLERVMLDAGALGGKAAGAGAGGSMFFVMRDDPAPGVAAAERCGARVIPVAWSERGVMIEGGTVC